MTTVKFIILAFLSILSTQTVYADSTETTAGVILEDGTRLRAGAIRDIPLNELTEDHEFYDMAIQAFQNQFGPDYFERAMQWQANENARRLEESRLEWQRHRRQGYRILMITIPFILLIGYIVRRKPNKDLNQESTNTQPGYCFKHYGNRFKFKYKNDRLTFLGWCITFALCFYIWIVTDGMLKYDTLINILFISSVLILPIVIPPLLISRNGYGILYEDYVEIDLKGKKYHFNYLDIGRLGEGINKFTGTQWYIYTSMEEIPSTIVGGVYIKPALVITAGGIAHNPWGASADLKWFIKALDQKLKEYHAANGTAESYKAYFY